LSRILWWVMVSSSSRLLRHAVLPGLARSFSSAAAPKGLVISPAAAALLRNNPSISSEGLAAKATHHTPTGAPVLTKGDVLVMLGKAVAPPAAAAQVTSAPKPPPAAAPPTPQAKPAVSEPAGTPGRRNLTHKTHRTHEDIPTTQIRKIIARRLLESKVTLPHAYMTVEVEMDALLALRAKYNARNGIKASVNDFLIKAVASSLRAVPEANAYWAEDAIKFNSEIDVAFAAATPAGLVTPVIKEAGAKSVAAVSAEAKDMASRARSNRLLPEEFTGGCTSVSNLGMFGIHEFIAVLNPPQSSIFAVGETFKKAFPDGNGGAETRQVMRVSLSHDARVIDDALAEKLCGALKEAVENPALIFAE